MVFFYLSWLAVYSINLLNENKVITVIQSATLAMWSLFGKYKAIY